jgi:hypothetical protein
MRWRYGARKASTFTAYHFNSAESSLVCGGRLRENTRRKIGDLHSITHPLMQ